jgi:ferredoxin
VTQFQITIDNTGEVFHCGPDRNVLEAMEAALCTGIPVGCRNGGCGACKARVVEGPYVARKMNRAVLSEEEQARGYVLACKTYPQGDLKLVAAGIVARRLAGFEFSMGWQSVERKKEA